MRVQSSARSNGAFFMATNATRYKKTMPFSKECAFYVPDKDGLFEECIDEATVGFYFTKGTMIGMMSLCPYHAIVQESLFIVGKE